MVGEIIFHLGDCKTGTTSVQATLAEGAWQTPAGPGGAMVGGRDILYPAQFNHIPLAKTLSVPAEAPHQAARFAKVRTAFEGSQAAHGVISAEHFEFVDPEAVARAIDTHLPGQNLRLIAYVRPHADRLVSTFAERAKKGLFQGDLAAMHARLLKDETLLYAPRFEKWRALFGTSFTLRPFVRDRLWQGDVVQDFFRFVLGREDFSITRETDQNESLSVEDIAMMRLVHGVIRKRHPGAEMRHAQQSLGWYMADILGAMPQKGGTRPRMHAALAEAVVAAYAEDAAALDAAFFEGTPMSDALAGAPAKAVAKAQTFEAPDHFSPAERRRFRAWGKFLGRVMASDPDHFNWAVRPGSQRAAKPPRARGTAEE